MFPWGFVQQPLTPRELLLKRLSEGVPPEDAAEAGGFEWDSIKEETEIKRAMAEGRVTLFERARDGGVSGAVRAALRYETKSWTPKAEASIGLTLEDYLKVD